MYNFCYLFLMFYIYSIVGYIIEVTACSIDQKKLVFSRGFCLGPYLPIFGVGSLGIVLFLNKFSNELMVLFVMSMFITLVVEYFTSFFLEKIFHLRWWDYSDKKFNLNGRICLEVGALFGIAGIILIKVVNPLIVKFLNLLSENLVCIIGIILFVLFIADMIISFYAVVKLKIDTDKLTKKDATSVIKKEVRKSLFRFRYFYKRIFEAFPNIKEENKDFKYILERLNKRKRKKND